MDREEFEAALSARRGSIKTVLTNQSVVARLGNLLADEILWRAKVRPSTHSKPTRTTSPRPTAAASTPRCAAPCTPRSPPVASHSATPG
ncbi:hypothetical protein [Streptomyces sp. T21Q-yed]|uniref:hypothetical protein n=1 Tax=unclassified Streptomyces TaxID=2593676 RepID=UPI0031FCECF3